MQQSQVEKYSIFYLAFIFFINLEYSL